MTIKSRIGASVVANSSQLLLRNSPIGKFIPLKKLDGERVYAALGVAARVKARKRPRPQWLSSIAPAMMLRAELPVHRNRTL